MTYMRTLFKCKCPECGHVGTAIYADHSIGQVACDACGMHFNADENTNRTRTEEQRRAYHREYNRRYYQAHREEMLEEQRIYRQKNRDAIRARERRWRAAHKEEQHARSIAYRQRVQAVFSETGEVPNGHGTSSAYLAGCRCPECVAYYSERYHARKLRDLRRKERQR